MITMVSHLNGSPYLIENCEITLDLISLVSHNKSEPLQICDSILINNISYIIYNIHVKLIHGALLNMTTLVCLKSEFPKTGNFGKFLSVFLNRRHSVYHVPKMTKNVTICHVIEHDVIRDIHAI